MTTQQKGSSGRGEHLVLSAHLDGQIRTWTLDRLPCRLGSSRRAEVVLGAPGISRLHARIFADDGDLWIEDLGSKNGTRIDGRRVETPQRLALGHALRLGTFELRIESREADDLAIGLELEDGPVVEPGPGALQGATTHDGMTVARTLTESAGHGLPGWIVTLAEELCVLNSTPDQTLARLLAELDAKGLMALELNSEGSPTEPWLVVARAGDGVDLEPPVDFLPAPDRPCSGSQEQSRWLWAPFAEGGGLLLLLAAPETQGQALELAGRVALHWITQLRGREVQAGLHHPNDESPPLQWPGGHIVSAVPAMQELYGHVAGIARSDLPVLILGETGSGKEHIAQLVHLNSGRPGPLVTVNCAAIPAELLEAELFGIVRGVATGVRERTGRFVEAQAGTLFLDEIGDLPLALQAKLLRVLQEQEVTPLGGDAVALDVRVVSATHADLEKHCESGSFRRDLFFRLAGLELSLPPLRHRGPDLAPLIRSFAKRAADGAGKSIRGFSLKAFNALQAFSWPGNIRQLEHEVRRAVLLCPAGGIVDSQLLSRTVLSSDDASSNKAQVDGAPSDPWTDGTPDFSRGLDNALRDLELHWIVKALESTAGNQTRAAKKLGISRNGLLHRMKKLQLEPDRFRSS